MNLSSSSTCSTTSADSSLAFPATTLSQMNTNAVRLLCEGQSEQALAMLCTCLTKAKHHLKVVREATAAAASATTAARLGNDNNANDYTTRTRSIRDSASVDDATSTATSTTRTTTTTTTSTESAQVALYEIPIDGAIREDDDVAQERDTSFTLYRFALLTCPINASSSPSSSPTSLSSSSLSSSDEDESDFATWFEEQDTNQDKQHGSASSSSASTITTTSTTTTLGATEGTTAASVAPANPDLFASQQQQQHQPQEEDQDGTFEEPWHVNTILTFCAVVTFNLGIIFQELGLAEGKVTHVSKARDLYKMGLTILQQQQQPQQQRESSVNATDSEVRKLRAWLSCALHNNAGHAASFLGDATLMLQSRRGLHRHLRQARQTPSASLFQASLMRANPQATIGPAAAAAA